MKRIALFLAVASLAGALCGCGYTQEDLYDRYKEGYADGYSRAEGDTWEDCYEYMQEEFMASMWEYIQYNKAEVVDRINSDEVLYVPLDDAVDAFFLGFYEAYQYCMYGNPDIDAANYVPYFSQEELQRLRDSGISDYGVYTHEFYEKQEERQAEARLDEILKEHQGVADEYGAVHDTAAPASHVYVIEHGRLYHALSCELLGRHCYIVTIQEAIEQGFIPCPLCQEDAP